MKSFQIPENATINFQVMCNPSGISLGCTSCERIIHKKKFYIEVTICGKTYFLSNREEFRCPLCNVAKSVTLLFDTGEEAMEYIQNFVEEFEDDKVSSIPLIDHGSGIRLSAEQAKSAHLN